MTELIQISYSPWSEKARWALDSHGIDYRRREYIPMLSAPAVRVRTRKLSGTMTVPILIADGAVLADSLEIARYADSHGSGPALFPSGHESEVERWNGKSERLMEAGRPLTTFRVGQSAAAKKEAAPPFARSLGPVAGMLASTGVSYIVRKYGLRAESVDDYRERMREVLLELRAGLGGGRDYLLDGLSYADIAMAAALQFVEPVADRYIRLGPATREAWTEPALSKEFGDVLEWRNRIYEEHR